MRAAQDSRETLVDFAKAKMKLFDKFEKVPRILSKAHLIAKQFNQDTSEQFNKCRDEGMNVQNMLNSYLLSVEGTLNE